MAMAQPSNIEQSANRSSNKLTKLLELDEAQKAAIKKIHITYFQNLTDLKKIRETAPKSYYIKKKNIREVADLSIKKMLNSSKQRATFAQIIRKRDSKAKDIIMTNKEYTDNKAALLRAADLY